MTKWARQLIRRLTIVEYSYSIAVAVGSIARQQSTGGEQRRAIAQVNSTPVISRSIALYEAAVELAVAAVDADGTAIVGCYIFEKGGIRRLYAASSLQQRPTVW